MNPAPEATGRGAVLGDFELGEKIGEGSMGTVYRGTDLLHHRPVAIKFLTQLAESPNALARFQREVQTAIRMDHPNIIRGYANGVWEGCIHYFVMEYVDGITLSDYMKRERIDEMRAVKIVLEIAQALKHINEFGLVHRDIKPDNIMLTADGTAKLADLGLAKSAEGDTELTMVGAVVGTPLYMSPEQARGSSSLDIRSDQYSLGATFYHLLTGGPPFTGQSAPEVIAKQIQEEPVPVGDLEPESSAGAQYVVAKMMQKNRDLRYGTPDALIADLELLVEGKGAAGTPDTPWSGEAAPESREWPFAFVPPDEDQRFCRTAIANKMVEPAVIEDLLDRQEMLAHGGFALKISYLAIERGHLKSAQVKKIEEALAERRATEDAGLVGKLAVKHNFVTQEQLDTVLQKQQERTQEGRRLRLVELLQEQGLLTSEQAEMVLSSQRKLRFGKEDDQVMDLALEIDAITDGQAERARLIHRNHIVMGRYRPIGDVLVERRYLAEPARDALVRAVRRARILETPVTTIWDRYVQRRNRKSDARKAEQLSDSYREQVKGFIKKGLAYRKAYRYYDAIASFEKVLGILSSNPDAERLIEETRTLLADLEQRRVRGTKLLEASLRELEYYRRLNPVDGTLGDDIGQFEERLSRLTGVAKARAQLKEETRKPPASKPPTPKPSPESASTKTLDEPAPSRRSGDDDLQAVTLAADRIEEVPDDLTQPTVREEDPRARRKEQVDRYLRQARRSAEQGRWSEARQKFEAVLEVDPGSRAGQEGLEWCDKVAGRKRLLWLAGSVVLVAASLTATVFIIGVPETEALLYHLLGGLRR